jgi:tight adherence protein C
MLTLILLIAATLSLLALAGGALILGSADRSFARRLAPRRPAALDSAAPPAGLDKTMRPALVELLKSWGGAGGSATLTAGKRGALRVRLLQAGFYSQRAVEAFYGLRVASAATMAAAGLLAAVLLQWLDPLHLAGLTLLAANIGLAAPKVYIASRIAHRRKALHQALPDGIDVMVVSIEAGATLTAAIQRVVEEFWDVHNILTEQFGVMMAEIQAGASRSDALARLAQRSPSQEVSALSTMLIQSEAVGASLGGTLRVFSDELRKARFVEAERKAAELPVKMAFPLVFCIFPALSGIVFIPVMLRLSHAFAGLVR